MRRAVERSSAPFQARKAPPPLLSPTSPADSSVITAGGTGGTDVLRERVPEQATRPETLLQSVARDHGPARGSDSGLWMCEPGSAVSAGAVRLTTICATQGREDWGWPYAWGQIRLLQDASNLAPRPAPSASPCRRAYCCVSLSAASYKHGNILRSIQKPTRHGRRSPELCHHQHADSHLKWSRRNRP
ncbi:hypothetical protein DPSP01_003418 [Paraphaeosphaeria sporulosa]